MRIKTENLKWIIFCGVPCVFIAAAAVIVELVGWAEGADYLDGLLAELMGAGK